MVKKQINITKVIVEDIYEKLTSGGFSEYTKSSIESQAVKRSAVHNINKFKCANDFISLSNKSTTYKIVGNPGTCIICNQKYENPVGIPNKFLYKDNVCYFQIPTLYNNYCSFSCAYEEICRDSEKSLYYRDENLANSRQELIFYHSLIYPGQKLYRKIDTKLKEPYGPFTDSDTQLVKNSYQEVEGVEILVSQSYIKLTK